MEQSPDQRLEEQAQQANSREQLKHSVKPEDQQDSDDDEVALQRDPTSVSEEQAQKQEQEDSTIDAAAAQDEKGEQAKQELLADLKTRSQEGVIEYFVGEIQALKDQLADSTTNEKNLNTLLQLAMQQIQKLQSVVDSLQTTIATSQSQPQQQQAQESSDATQSAQPAQPPVDPDSGKYNPSKHLKFDTQNGTFTIDSSVSTLNKLEAQKQKRNGNEKAQAFALAKDFAAGKKAAEVESLRQRLVSLKAISDYLNEHKDSFAKPSVKEYRVSDQDDDAIRNPFVGMPVTVVKDDYFKVLTEVVTDHADYDTRFWVPLTSQYFDDTIMENTLSQQACQDYEDKKNALVELKSKKDILETTEIKPLQTRLKELSDAKDSINNEIKAGKRKQSDPTTQKSLGTIGEEAQQKLAALSEAEKQQRTLIEQIAGLEKDVQSIRHQALVAHHFVNESSEDEIDSRYVTGAIQADADNPVHSGIAVVSPASTNVVGDEAWGANLQSIEGGLFTRTTLSRTLLSLDNVSVKKEDGLPHYQAKSLPVGTVMASQEYLLKPYAQNKGDAIPDHKSLFINETAGAQHVINLASMLEKYRITVLSSGPLRVERPSYFSGLSYVDPNSLESYQDQAVVMKMIHNTIRNQIRAAIKERASILLLTGFGVGEYGHKAENIARFYHEVLSEREFVNKFQKVYVVTNDQTVFDAFTAKFAYDQDLTRHFDAKALSSTHPADVELPEISHPTDDDVHKRVMENESSNLKMRMNAIKNLLESYLKLYKLSLRKAPYTDTVTRLLKWCNTDTIGDKIDNIDLRRFKENAAKRGEVFTEENYTARIMLDELLSDIYGGHYGAHQNVDDNYPGFPVEILDEWRSKGSYTASELGKRLVFIHEVVMRDDSTVKQLRQSGVNALQLCYDMVAARKQRLEQQTATIEESLKAAQHQGQEQQTDNLSEGSKGGGSDLDEQRGEEQQVEAGQQESKLPLMPAPKPVEPPKSAFYKITTFFTGSGKPKAPAPTKPDSATATEQPTDETSAQQADATDASQQSTDGTSAPQADATDASQQSTDGTSAPQPTATDASQQSTDATSAPQTPAASQPSLTASMLASGGSPYVDPAQQQASQSPAAQDKSGQGMTMQN